MNQLKELNKPTVASVMKAALLGGLAGFVTGEIIALFGPPAAVLGTVLLTIIELSHLA